LWKEGGENRKLTHASEATGKKLCWYCKNQRGLRFETGWGKWPQVGYESLGKTRGKKGFEGEKVRNLRELVVITKKGERRRESSSGALKDRGSH